MTTQPHFDDSQPRSDDGRFGAKRRAENHLDLVDSPTPGFDAAQRARRCGYQVTDRPAVTVDGTEWSCGRCEASGKGVSTSAAESMGIEHSRTEHPDPGNHGFTINYVSPPTPSRTDARPQRWASLGTPRQVSLSSFAQSAGARYEPHIADDPYFSGLVRDGLVEVDGDVARLTEAGWLTLESKLDVDRARAPSRPAGHDDNDDKPPF